MARARRPQNAKYHPARYAPRRQQADIVNAKLKDWAAFRIASAESDTRFPHIVDALGAAHDRCIYCEEKVKRYNIDELVPITKGGSMANINRVPCCGSCNSSKGDTSDQAFVEWLDRGTLARQGSTRRPIATARCTQIKEYSHRYRRALTLPRAHGAQWSSFRTQVAELWREFDARCGAMIQHADA